MIPIDRALFEKQMLVLDFGRNKKAQKGRVV